MALTGQLGTIDSQPGNFQLGAGEFCAPRTVTGRLGSHLSLLGCIKVGSHPLPSSTVTSLLGTATSCPGNVTLGLTIAPVTNYTGLLGTARSLSENVLLGTPGGPPSTDLTGTLGARKSRAANLLLGTDNATSSAPDPVAVSETVTLAEALAAIHANITGVSQTVSLTEALATVKATLVAVSETIAIVESLAITQPATGNVSESVVLSEGLSVLQQNNVETSASNSLTEGLTLLGDADVAISEALSLAESLDDLHAAYVSADETVTLAEAIEETASLAEAVAELISLFEELSTQIDFNEVPSETVTLIEDLLTTCIGHVDVSDSVSLITDTVATTAQLFTSVADDEIFITDSVFSAGQVTVTGRTPTTLTLDFGGERQLAGVIDLRSYTLTPLNGGVPISFLSVTPIQTEKDSASNCVVLGTDYDASLRAAFTLRVDDTLDVEQGDYLNLTLTNIDYQELPVLQVVEYTPYKYLSVLGPIVTNDPTSGAATLTVLSAVTGCVLETTEGTGDYVYRLSVNAPMRKKQGDLFHSLAFYTAVAINPIVEDVGYLVSDGTVVVTFSKPMSDNAALLNPALYSLSGPSTAIVKGVRMLTPTQLVLTTVGLVSGFYELTLPELQDRSLNPLIEIP